MNFSSVLDKLSANIGESAASMGLIGSCFFFTYALGQIINGRLGDRISPFHFIPVSYTHLLLLFHGSIRITLCNSDTSVKKQERYVQQLIRSGVAGIIIVPVITDDPRKMYALYEQLCNCLLYTSRCV